MRAIFNSVVVEHYSVFLGIKIILLEVSAVCLRILVGFRLLYHVRGDLARFFDKSYFDLLTEKFTL